MAPESYNSKQTNELDQLEIDTYNRVMQDILNKLTDKNILTFELIANSSQEQMDLFFLKVINQGHFIVFKDEHFEIVPDIDKGSREESKINAIFCPNPENINRVTMQKEYSLAIERLIKEDEEVAAVIAFGSRASSYDYYDENSDLDLVIVSNISPQMSLDQQAQERNRIETKLKELGINFKLHIIFKNTQSYDNYDEDLPIWANDPYSLLVIDTDGSYKQRIAALFSNQDFMNKRKEIINNAKRAFINKAMGKQS